MMSIPPESSGKTRARKVFGDVVLDEVETLSVGSNSLTYSPSPKVVRRKIPHSDASVLGATNDIGSQKPNRPDKENDGSSINSSGVQVAESASSTTANVSKARVVNLPMQQQKELQRLREQSRSPKRRDLVKKTQEAINQATTSVNDSLNAVRRAKTEKYHERATEAAKFREQWHEDKEEAREFFAEAEKSRRELLALQRQLSSKFNHARAQRNLEERTAQLSSIEQESQFKSEVFRDHQRSLKEERDTKRRNSVEARRKIRDENRRGEERLRMMRIEEDQALIEERHLSSLAMRTSKRALAEQRRKSFQFRNGDARRIRELHSKLEAERREREHQSALLKWAGEKDADDYRKRMEEERRNSFAFRNEEGRRQRQEAARHKSEEQQEEHEGFLLKWGGEKDADDYRRQMEQDRRNSLEFRGEEHRRHQKVMQELRSLAQEKETESLMLKWAGQNDAKAYLSRLEEERRKSLAFRNDEGKRHRDLEEEEHQKRVHEAHVEEALQAGCHQDVEAYQKKCAARDRASLVYRRKEANVQRLQDESRVQQEKQVEQENRRLEDGARGDVENYLKDCKSRRRLSLAFRAQEKRRHAKWEQQEAERKREQCSQDTRDRARDQRHVELARQQERARVAMDAIRHAGCTFTVNPFAGLLDKY